MFIKLQNVKVNKSGLALLGARELGGGLIWTAGSGDWAQVPWG